MTKREVIEVYAKNGEKMVGILTSPETRAGPKRMVLFCQAGLQNKGGVGDYFRWLGDELTDAGFYVLRFDQRTTGDADGDEFEEVTLNTFYRRLQEGLFFEDTVTWLEWGQRALRPAESFLWAQCGGSFAALMVSAAMPKGLSGLICLAPPVLYTTEDETLRSFDAQVVLKQSFRKLRDPRAIFRFLTGKSQYDLVLDALKFPARRARAWVSEKASRYRSTAVPDHPLFNQHLWRAFEGTMRHEIPILFLLSEMDSETPDFETEFKQKVLDHSPKYQRLCQVRYLMKADHSLMFQPSRVESRDIILGWLRQHSRVPRV